MRYLLISLIALFTSCASYPKKQHLTSVEVTKNRLEIPYFSNPEMDYVYKANIEVFDQYFGGLLIIKKVASKKHRIAFTTEMGNKIFDFLITPDAFTVNFIPEELNKKMLLKILEKDFRALITDGLVIIKAFSNQEGVILEGEITHETHFFQLDSKENLAKIIYPKYGKEVITYRFSEINSNIAQKIEIAHASKNMNITLNLL